MSLCVESTEFNVDGGMTPELRDKILEWGERQGSTSFDYHGSPSWTAAELPDLMICPQVFESLDAIHDYVNRHIGSYFIAARYRVPMVPRDQLESVQEKLRLGIQRRDSFLQEVAPWNRASKTVSCKKCGCRWDCEDLRLRNEFCCSCGAFLLSATNQERLLVMNKRNAALGKEVIRLMGGVPSKKTAWYVQCAFIE